LILNNGILSTVEAKEAHVIALACQTANEDLLLPLSCETKFKDIDSGMVNHKLACPKSCAKENGTAYGTVLYHESSNVCMSMAHSEQYDEVGDVMMAVVMRSKKQSAEFQGSATKDVVSDTLDQQGWSYTISKMIDVCPKEV